MFTQADIKEYGLETVLECTLMTYGPMIRFYNGYLFMANLGAFCGYLAAEALSALGV